MKYEQGDIVWVEFPFSDSPSSGKKRPALIISNSSNNSIDQDYILLQITSKIRNDSFVFNLSVNSLSSPIPVESQVRCNKLATVRTNLIAGRLSSVTKNALLKIFEKTAEAIAVRPEP